MMHGKSLDHLIHKQERKNVNDGLHKAITFSKKLELLLDVVKGMMYLHSLQPVIVHRDLKPSVSVPIDKLTG
jgi:serine/threonine protein kinase